jgi:hypothetical protein
MTAVPAQYSGEIRLALRQIVSEYGPSSLSDPGVVASMRSDLLPQASRVSRVLVAAAEDRIAAQLQENISRGVDVTTASNLAAASFCDSTMFSPEVCNWAVREIAVALGLFGANVPPAAMPGTARAQAAPPGQPAPHVARAPAFVPRPGQPAARPRTPADEPVLWPWVSKRRQRGPR